MSIFAVLEQGKVAGIFSSRNNAVNFMYNKTKTIIDKNIHNIVEGKEVLVPSSKLLNDYFKIVERKNTKLKVPEHFRRYRSKTVPVLGSLDDLD